MCVIKNGDIGTSLIPSFPHSVKTLSVLQTQLLSTNKILCSSISLRQLCNQNYLQFESDVDIKDVVFHQSNFIETWLKTKKRFRNEKRLKICIFNPFILKTKVLPLRLETVQERQKYDSVKPTKYSN